MWQSRFNRVAVAVGLVILLSVVVVSIAGAYAEEPIYFRDPLTGQLDENTEVSTIHTDLTYVLALAAGFSVDDSRTLMIWNQLVDSERITTRDKTYTNCYGTFPDRPIENEVCDDTSGVLFWPSWGQVKSTADGAACVTSRYGPFEGSFHFPHRLGWEIDALKAWAWNPDTELIGYQGYVWGPPGMISFFGHTCFYTQTLTIDTGIPSGSLEALATYLHSLADSYSHEACQRETDKLGWAWPTHTYPYAKNQDETIYECNYAFSSMLRDIGDSHHGREFGTGWPDDSVERTDLAIRAVYEELQARSSAQEGVYQPLSLDTPLKGRFHKLTLDEALYYYVHHWYFDEPHARRAYADQLAVQILAQRVPIDR